MTKAGVGTNRYAYAGNDPVNLSDPGGNFAQLGAAEIEALIASAAPVARAATTLGARALLGPFAVVVAILSPTKLGDGTMSANHARTIENAAKVGVILTIEDAEAGYHVDGLGYLRDSNGNVVASRQFSNAVPNTQEEFDKSRYDALSQNAREKYTRDVLTSIAKARGWVKSPNATKANNGRLTFKTQDGTYRAIDLTHGRYEVHDKKGKHVGEENIEGKPTKAPNPNYDIKL